MQRCNRCGAEARDNATYCSRCGYPFKIIENTSPQPDRSDMRQEETGSSTSKKQRRKQRSFLAGLLLLLGIRRNPQTGALGCAPVPATISVALVAAMIIGIMVGPVLKAIPPFAPGLTVIGNVVPGGSVDVHGTNFPAGSHINLTLDGVSIGLAPTSRHSISHSLYDISLSAVQMSPLQQTEQPSASTITVRDDGTFDAQISIPQGWQPNSQHIIQAQAIGQDGSVQTQVQQTVTIPESLSGVTLTQGISNASPTTPSGPSVTPTSATSTTQCSNSTTGTGTDLTFTFPGKAPCLMSDVSNNYCTIDKANFIFGFEVTGIVNGMTYTFQIVTAAYYGARTYTTMTIDVGPGSSLNVNQGWVTGMGTVMVNSDEKSGSVNALMNKNLHTSGSVQVTGNFACS